MGYGCVRAEQLREIGSSTRPCSSQASASKCGRGEHGAASERQAGRVRARVQMHAGATGACTWASSGVKARVQQRCEDFRRSRPRICTERRLHGRNQQGDKDREEHELTTGFGDVLVQLERSGDGGEAR